jgi:hypothetical protein
MLIPVPYLVFAQVSYRENLGDIHLSSNAPYHRACHISICINVSRKALARTKVHHVRVLE